MMRIHVTIYCPSITDPDGVDADWVVAEVSDALACAGLEAGGCTWSIDDATVEGGES